jgi:uncharacterized protein
MADQSDRAFLGVGWAFPIAPTNGDVSMAAYEEDVRQAILIILETNPGERVMRPDFGAGLRAMIFEPISTTALALVQTRVQEALTLWEPRINLREVSVTRDATSPAVLRIKISYEIRATNTFYNIVYPFYLQEQHP